MDRIPQVPPLIHPLLNVDDRPLWSVMIPVYNCSKFIEETLRSVLDQDPGSQLMQIEVVDDASTDADVEAMVKAIGKGRVDYYRQPQNVGSLRNFETCINRSKGHLVHLLHGDDRVLTGFYRKFTELFERFPQAGAAFCQHASIDFSGKQQLLSAPEMETDGLLVDWLPEIAQRNRLQYVSTVVKRSVYEHLGSFYGVTFGEDWEMWVRIASSYPIAYTPDLLADYRCHDNSISDHKLASGQAIRDLRIVIDRIQAYLPDERKKRIYGKATKYYLSYGMYGAYNSWKASGNYSGIRNSIREAFNLHSGFTFYTNVSKIFFKIVLHRYVTSKPTGSKMITKLFDLFGREVPD